MKVAFSVLTLVASILLLHGMDSPDEILELSQTRDFHVFELDTGTSIDVDIMGSPVDSSLAVRDLAVRRDGGRLLVEVRVAIATTGQVGMFRRRVHIPDDIDSVVFGQNSALVWQRDWCRYQPADSVPVDSITSFKVDTREIGRVHRLPMVILSGELEASGVQIDRVSTRLVGDSLYVFAFSKQNVKALPESRKLFWKLIIPEDVNRILFGPGGMVVWERVN